nr:uncharacterized protein LOC129279862 [Lytechinus pictus]
MHNISEYLAPSGNSMASLFTANPFGFLFKLGDSDEVASRQSLDSGSMDRNTISDLQVRMMMWEFEAYLNGDHKKDGTPTNSTCELGDEGLKPSCFQNFTSLVNSGKSNTFLKDHPGKRLKLEQLCGELHYKNSRKVMEQFRDCVLSVSPSLKSSKMTELFEIILRDTLEGQRDAEAAWRADPRNMNKLSTEYIGSRISRAVDTVSSLFNQTSSKVMPVVDFLLGTDDDEGSGTDDGSQTQPPFNGYDSEMAPGYDRRITQGVRELERRKAGERQPRCTLRVNDETQIKNDHEIPCAGPCDGTSGMSQLPHPGTPHVGSDDVLNDSGFARGVERNINNCAYTMDTEIEMQTFCNHASTHDDKMILIEKEMKVKRKPGKIMKRIAEGSVCSDDVYLDVQL